MQEKASKRGSFIAFEGIDGSGKTTQSRLLAARLQRAGVSCFSTCEPTGSPIGTMIRQILTGQMSSDNKVIAALFVADRLDHLLDRENGLLVKIGAGTSVISDRYYFSSYAYNSIDMPMDWVISANSQSAELLRPTATVFIDVPPDDALQRISRSRSQLELFETRERLVSVRERYFEAFEKLKDVENVIIVDGSQSEQAVEAEVWDKVHQYFE